MSVLTQGTHVFFLDETGGPPTIVKVEAATQFDPGGDPADQLDDTDLDSMEYEYKAGLRNPGQGSMTIRADPAKASHLKMYELSRMNPSPNVKWFVGWSDGTEPPTWDATGETVNLPTTRTWFKMEGYISDFPFNFQTNSLVETQLTIQRSGGSEWIKKGATP